MVLQSLHWQMSPLSLSLLFSQLLFVFASRRQHLKKSLKMLTEIIASVVILLAIIQLCFKNKLPKGRLPPGPYGVPILGYLPFLNPVAPYLTLTNLCDRFGKVFSVQLGQVTCIVLADAAVIRQAFSRSDFSGRAPLYLTHGIMNGFGLICAEGDLWKCQRKFTADFMRKFGMTSWKVTLRSVIEADKQSRRPL